MAESFSSYGAQYNFGTSANDQSKTIVPIAGGRLSDAGCSGSRAPGSTLQLHSIYLSQVVTQTYSDPTSKIAYVSLRVVDTNGGSWFIANNVMVLPHSSFYIEKTITLLPTQSLQLIFSKNTINTSGATIHSYCSGVDII